MADNEERLPALRAPNGTDCSDEWLSRALRKPVKGVETKVIGVGESSTTVRASFTDANNPSTRGSVVLKVASEKPESRRHGIENLVYEREVMFYREFAKALPTIPDVYATCLDKDGVFTIVMQDLKDAWQIDNMLGCDVPTAKRALSALAATQGPRLSDYMWAGQIVWLNKPQVYNAGFAVQQWPLFKSKWAGKLPNEQMDLYEWFVERALDWDSSVVPPLGLCHNDFRLDNILFTKSGVKIVDWATCSWGPAFRDVAYFFGTSLKADIRRKHGKELFEHYLQELDVHSEVRIPKDQAYKAFAYQSFHVISLLIGACAALDLSGRGKDLGVAMFTTAFDFIKDIGAKQIVLDTIAYAKKPLVPAASDDALHAVAPGENFNESYYNDVHAPDASASIYIRYGRLPNQNKSLVYIVILKQGHPTYQIELEDAPCPPADDRVCEFDVPGLCWFKHTVLEPLKAARIQVKGKATAYKDPTKPIWGFAGDPKLVDIEFDITFTHVGTPFMWRLVPRWEAPTNGKGTYKINGEAFTIEGPGQRDHSWGLRDWFSLNCMWANLHFEDGTRIQCMTEYQHNTVQQGYTQKDGVVEEHTSCLVDADWEMDYKLKRAVITLQPGNLEIALTPVMQGGHRIVGPENRANGYPRVLCKLQTKDGRKGVGIAEWFFMCVILCLLLQAYTGPVKIAGLRPSVHSLQLLLLERSCDIKTSPVIKSTIQTRRSWRQSIAT